MLAMFVVMLAASITAISGNGDRLPLDAHEIFVARTAEEMFARNSVIVPFNNDEPRVKKPPLAYWLVMGVDWINDHDHLISEWEARVPSIVAGVLLAGLTCALGITLFGIKTGLISGLLIAASGGYVQYTHSARPEMLYAACCAAAMLGFAKALSPSPGGRGGLFARNSLAAWSGWLMFGLAILAKGPQLPLLILIGLFIFSIREHGWRTAAWMLRPLTGILIMLAISAWWFVIVRMRIPQSGATWTGETLMRYVNTEGDPLTQFLHPYYIYRTAGLILPWVILYPLAIAAPLFPFMKEHPGARMSWWLLIVPLMLLHVSLGRRWYYMLPVMGPMAVLIAWGAVQVGRQLLADGRAYLWRIIWISHVIALILAMAWLQRTAPPELRPPNWALWAVLLAASAALILIVRNPLTSPRMIGRDLVTVFAFGAVFYAAAAAKATIWRIDRLEDRGFSREVGNMVAEHDVLLGWQTDWEMVQYYNHRAIPSPMKTADLNALLRQALRADESHPDRCVWLLVNSKKPVKLPRPFQMKEVHRLDTSSGEQSLQLWRITVGDTMPAPESMPVPFQD